jgi:FaeA-like protein
LQIIPELDVTRGRTAKSVLPLMRGLLHDLPHSRIGLLTHRRLAKELPALLSKEDRGRLVEDMVHYFGGGLSRGSNLWIKTCDALIVLGTPRIHPNDIRLHLFRLGKVKAAGRTKEEAGWGWDYWSGVTESGQRRTVKCWHYADHDWHSAYCSLVRSELVQAIGRGRGILPEGIPVYVVTTENLAPPHDDDGRNGFPLVEEGRFAPLTDAQVRVLACLTSPSPTTTRAVAHRLGVSQRKVREHLAELVRAGRVRKVGETRGGGAGGWQALAVDAGG